MLENDNTNCLTVDTMPLHRRKVEQVIRSVLTEDVSLTFLDTAKDWELAVDL
jgi:hypothetical protein